MFDLQFLLNLLSDSIEQLRYWFDEGYLFCDRAFCQTSKSINTFELQEMT